jgi:hypothetical protein
MPSAFASPSRRLPIVRTTHHCFPRADGLDCSPAEVSGTSLRAVPPPALLAGAPAMLLPSGLLRRVSSLEAMTSVETLKDSLSISQQLTRCSPVAVTESCPARLGAFASSLTASPVTQPQGDRAEPPILMTEASPTSHLRSRTISCTWRSPRIPTALRAYSADCSRRSPP